MAEVVVREALDSPNIPVYGRKWFGLQGKCLRAKGINATHYRRIIALDDNIHEYSHEEAPNLRVRNLVLYYYDQKDTTPQCTQLY